MILVMLIVKANDVCVKSFLATRHIIAPNHRPDDQPAESQADNSFKYITLNQQPCSPLPIKAASCAISQLPAMAKTSLLDHLRTRSQVACDTLDASIASSLGPFIDCTSNQAIAYLELAHTRHEETIKQARQLAQELAPSYPDVSVQALAVDIAVRFHPLLLLSPPRQPIRSSTLANTASPLPDDTPRPLHPTSLDRRNTHPSEPAFLLLHRPDHHQCPAHSLPLRVPRALPP